MIKLDFEMTNGTYTYRDALYLPEDHVLTDEEIEAIKQARFDRWIAAITAPVEDIPPVEDANVLVEDVTVDPIVEVI